MSALGVKLWRDLWRLRAQAAAITLVVAAGVGMMVMSFGMIRSLETTRAAYYDLYRFADLWAPVRRAPNSLLADIRAVPGVAVAEGRISASAILDVPGVQEPVTARVHGLPANRSPALNQLVLQNGRLPEQDRPDEVVVNEAFAGAARLTPGDRVGALLHGNRIDLRIVGTVLSPEHVYAVAPGQIFPDNRRFGIVWMGEEGLAAALDLTQAFNEVVVRTGPGAVKPEVVRRLDLLLAPYGGTGAFGRDLQTSDRFVTSEIDQLATTVRILPPIFLLVAAFLLNIVLSRLVDTEREVIGLLKAFGYRDRDVMLHYGQLAILLSVGGLVVGIAFGLVLGRALAGLYQDFFTFPFLHFRAGADVYLIAIAATLAAVLSGAALAVRRAAGLTPAIAMRPPTPPDFSGGLAAALSKASPDEPTRMIVRGLVRRPLRSAASVLGVAAALALYIASASATDNVERLITLSFDQGSREQLTIAFLEARDAHALHALARLPGVIRVEPFRAVPATLVFGPGIARESLTGFHADADLSRLINLEGRVIPPPVQGALVSTRLARKLKVGAGDTITATVTDGERPVLPLRIAGVIDSTLGVSAYLDRATLNRMLREGDVISGAYLSVDSDALPHLYRLMKTIPQIAGITVREAVLRGIRETVARNMGIVTLFNTGFAGLIVLGVVYNSGRISLSERARDLASLRVLGFRRSEVGFILLGEQALLVIAALPIGIAAGIGLSRYMADRFSSDLYTIPFGVQVATLAEGVLVVAAAAAATALTLRIRTDRLDLVRALKTRE